MLKISTKLPDEERHYLSNLIRLGKAEVPNENGEVSRDAHFKLVLENGFVVSAVRILKEGALHGLRNPEEFKKLIGKK